MTREAREFIQSNTTLLDHLLTTLTQEEQHELLDALAAEIEERLDLLVESSESLDPFTNDAFSSYGSRAQRS